MKHKELEWYDGGEGIIAKMNQDERYVTFHGPQYGKPPVYPHVVIVVIFFALAVLFWNDHVERREHQILQDRIQAVEQNQGAALFAQGRGR